jgi:hypothetical protein
MTLARFPNVDAEGGNQWVSIDQVNDPQGSFYSNNSRPLKWSSEQDPWIHGYWGFDWADTHLPVTGVKSNGSGSVIQVCVHVCVHACVSLHMCISSSFTELKENGSENLWNLEIWYIYIL